MASQKKIQIVSSIVEKLQRNPNFVVVDFDSAPHQTLESLRKMLRESASELHVIKNSLFKVALAKMKHADMTEKNVLVGSTAVMTLPADWISALASFFKFTKNNEAFTFKIGLIDGMVYEKPMLEKLAQLPTREELIVKIIGSMKSSQSRVVYAMNFGMNKLVNTLKQASQKN